MGQVIELSRGAEGRYQGEDEWIVTLQMTEGEFLRVCELTARLAFVHHTFAQASKDAGDELAMLMEAVLDPGEPSERRRLAQRAAAVVREVPEAAKRARAARLADAEARRAEEEAARQAERARQRWERDEAMREHDERMLAWRRLPQERRDELLLRALSDERLTIREWTARLNAQLCSPSPGEGRPTVYPSTVTKMAKRMTAHGELDRVGEQFQGKVRYRYARRHQTAEAVA